LPLAIALPGRNVTLLEASERKATFLVRIARGFPNVYVVRGRAEEQQTDRFGVAVAKALASPPVAAEWCLPLVRPGGGVVLWVGPSAEADRVGRVAAQLGGELAGSPAGFLVVQKLAPTPPGFPRRPGMARKRPLG
jgi:16S rRNA (guanine527-N7)-methyltransferase